MLADVKSQLEFLNKPSQRTQRKMLIVSFLCWFLSALDFFLLIVILPTTTIANDLKDGDPHGYSDVTNFISGWVSGISHVLRFLIPNLSPLLDSAKAPIVIPANVLFFAVTFTIASRFFGAVIFGLLADYSDRRKVLVIVMILFSVAELLTAFSPGVWVFIGMRALFGVGMGGAWAIGASLAMGQAPPRARGLFSGIYQSGYPLGNLVAALAAALAVLLLHVSWQGIFIAGGVIGLVIGFVLALYLWPRGEPEAAARQSGTLPSDRRSAAVRPKLARGVYAVLLMIALTFMSHGTQDIYPTFLTQVADQVGVKGAAAGFVVGLIVAIYTIGGICGGIVFGISSEYWGRRRAIIGASVIGLLLVPLWTGLFPWGLHAFQGVPEAAPAWPALVLLTLGAFLMQFAVQGAWGVIPVHLIELSPPGVRTTFPGLAYGLGVSFASPGPLIVAVFAAALATPGDSHGRSVMPNYSLAQAAALVVVFLAVITIAVVGPHPRKLTAQEFELKVEKDIRGKELEKVASQAARQQREPHAGGTPELHSPFPPTLPADLA